MKQSIQMKILISFSVIIFIGLSSLLFVSYRLTEQNDYNIINADMVTAKRNLDQYLKQYFQSNKLEFDKASLVSRAEDVSVQLSLAIGSNVNIYDLNGKRLSHSFEPDYPNMKKEDLLNAVKGRISYATPTYDYGTKVSMSYPIRVNGVNIGILRYTKDYTHLFNNSRRFRYVINAFAVAIFVIIFIAVSIISRQITKPIKKLAETIEQVSGGNFDIDIDINSKDEGDGIAEANIERIFDPFFRVSKKTSGESGSAGLGLTIVKEIVKRHGGVIKVRSRVNQGTEVIISFGESEKDK